MNHRRNYQYMGGQLTKPAYDKHSDPCNTRLEAYLACVEGKKGGLRDGDECEEESKAYKLCRAEEKKNETKRSNGSK